MNTMNTFDHMPMPNQISTSGTSATRGVEYNAVRNGSKTIASRRYQPMITPSTTPADDRQADANHEVGAAVGDVLLQPALRPFLARSA